MTTRTDRFVVGLTGGIGSGKSSVAARFAQHGAFIIDADAIAHELTRPHGPAIAAIAAAFPGVVAEGVLDRDALRARVFAEPGERIRLEGMLHPMIRAATELALASPEAAAAPYVIHMVPLLFESKNAASAVDCAVVVDVDEDTQIERVTRTRGMSQALVRQIIASQMPRTERLKRTQFVIDNAGSPAALDAQVAQLHRVFVANAARRSMAAIQQDVAA
jgi:dephospho-CoA kinase